MDRQGWPSGICRQQEGGTQFNRCGYDQGIRQPQLGSVLGPQPRRGCSNLPSDWLNSSRKSCEKLIDLRSRVRSLPEWPDEYFGVGGGRDGQLFAPTSKERQTDQDQLTGSAGFGPETIAHFEPGPNEDVRLAATDAAGEPQ